MYIFTDFEAYFCAQDLAQYQTPATPLSNPGIQYGERAYNQIMSYESSRLPLPTQDLLPSLVTSATSSQSSFIENFAPGCLTPELSVPASSSAFINVDGIHEGMEAYADSSSRGLGLGLGGAVTIPEFGWAVLAPESRDSTKGHETLYGLLHNTNYLSQSVELGDEVYGAAGPNYPLRPTAHPLDVIRRARSVVPCLQGDDSVSSSANP
jgi:hypothetical protein